MLFHQDSLPPLVWDHKRQKVRVQFIDGVFDADGDDIEFLIAVGYRQEEAPKRLRGSK